MPGPKLIGAWIIDQELGSGGFATVYLAHHSINHSEVVAIKVPHLDLVKSNPQILERFFREAKSMYDLKHPNIVQIRECGRDGDTWFIAMEYIEDGYTLKRILEYQDEPISITYTLKIFEGVLSAMCYAHSKKIIHRDIKPSNILLTPDLDAKVSDFGIAKVIGLDSDTVKTTRAIGTYAYMSPEQIMTPTDVDTRSDVYSLGITLYELLTNRHPFQEVIDDPSSYKIQDAHINKIPLPPSHYRKTVTEALDALISKCMDKDKLKRFNDARDLKAEFDMIALDILPELEILPPAHDYKREPPPPPPPPPPPLPAPRNLKAVWIAAVSIIVIAGAVAAYLLLGNPGQDFYSLYVQANRQPFTVEVDGKTMGSPIANVVGAVKIEGLEAGKHRLTIRPTQGQPKDTLITLKDNLVLSIVF